MKPVKKLSKQQFAPIPRPGFTDVLKFPDDITKMSIQQVGSLLGQYTAMQCYAISSLSRVSQELLKVESEQRMTRIHIISRMGDVREKWRQDQFVDFNPGMQKLAAAELKLKVEKEHLAAYAQIFERYASVLSRELSRRTSEMDKRL